MKKLLFLLLLCSFTIMNIAQEREQFDPKKNPAKDLKTAEVKAKKENKKILLDVGGEWCPWCHRIDEFINSNKDLKDYLTKNYVVVKVNYSKENKNEAFLSNYPKVDGYPHFFVLDKNGKLLKSKNTGELEAEKSYDKVKFIAFLKEYATKK